MTATPVRALSASCIIVMMAIGLASCGPAIHDKLETMEPQERFAQLDSWPTEKLCMGYTNIFLQPETDKQIATILRARGTKVCNTVRGRREVPNSSQQVASRDGGTSASFNAGFPGSQIASTSQTPAARISYETFKPTISIENLRSVAESVRSYQPKDQFDLGPDLTSLIGKTFVAEVTPRARGIQNEIFIETFWFYVSRITGRDCHYRNSDRDASSGRPAGSRSGPSCHLHEQSSPARIGRYEL